MAPPMRRRVDELEQVLDDFDLVGDLGAAEDGDAGVLGIAWCTCRGTSSSFSISRPAAAGLRKAMMPSVEAWARWAVPKASLT